MELVYIAIIVWCVFMLIRLKTVYKTVIASCITYEKKKLKLVPYYETEYEYYLKNSNICYNETGITHIKPPIGQECKIYVNKNNPHKIVPFTQSADYLFLIGITVVAFVIQFIIL